MEVEQQHEVKLYNSDETVETTTTTNEDCDIDVLASEGETDDVKSPLSKKLNFNNNMSKINNEETPQETSKPNNNEQSTTTDSTVINSADETTSIDSSQTKSDPFEFQISGSGMLNFEQGKINYFQIHVNSTQDSSVSNKNNSELFLIDNLSVYLNNSLEKDLILDAFIQTLDSNSHLTVSYFPVRIPTNTEYELHVKYDGKEVTGSPWKVGYKQENKNKRKYEEPKQEEGIGGENMDGNMSKNNGGGGDASVNIMASPQKRAKLDNNNTPSEVEINIMD
eukprot:TRINITY_DN4438_c0_g1_i1.p1 TRINITY_DN4438_c0_g1~~TRINITY_DN4438_c0_g1_i1.p1  ORF type:complete len:280 (-),score=83.33 TRINITY_DN4438_c0_g1_i1:11-850(-)